MSGFPVGRKFFEREEIVDGTDVISIIEESRCSKLLVHVQHLDIVHVLVHNAVHGNTTSQPVNAGGAGRRGGFARYLVTNCEEHVGLGKEGRKE